VQLLPEKVLKMFHIGEALNIKVHITQKGGCFFSAATGEKSFLIRMKSRKHIKSKHKAYKKELYVFIATTDRQKILKILCYTTLAKDNYSLLVKTGNGPFV
jgi:hypothetical protein